MSAIFTYVAIPADDFERAMKFYSEATRGQVQRNPNAPFPMAYFRDREGRNVGHLFHLPTFRPSQDGPIIYLDAAENLDEALARVERAGGRILMGKTPIAPGKGHWALFLDSEGNRLALHSIE
jgi:predicted enzyme related to lactoylglutathione lyase